SSNPHIGQYILPPSRARPYCAPPVILRHSRQSAKLRCALEPYSKLTSSTQRHREETQRLQRGYSTSFCELWRLLALRLCVEQTPSRTGRSSPPLYRQEPTECPIEGRLYYIFSLSSALSLARCLS